MAFYLDIRKLEENTEYVIYEFGDNDSEVGKLCIQKADGGVKELQSAPGDNSGRRFQRAASKVIEHWKNGEYPTGTCWAS